MTLEDLLRVTRDYKEVYSRFSILAPDKHGKVTGFIFEELPKKYFKREVDSVNFKRNIILLKAND